MGMHVDQAGQAACIRQIDRRVSGSRSDFSGWRDLRNLVAFNHEA